MKKRRLSVYFSFGLGLLMASSSLSLFQSAAACDDHQSSVPKNLLKIQTFDADAHSITVNGEFPNSCYDVGRVEAQENAEQHSLDVYVFKKMKKGNCLMMVSPFSTKIAFNDINKMAELSKGEHTLRVAQSDGTFLTKKITIK